MSAMVKALGPGFPFAEVVLFRALLGLPMMTLLLRHTQAPFRPQRWSLLLLRGVLGACAMLAYFFALQHALFADIAVLTRLQPVLIASLSPLVLHEKVPRAAIASLVLSFAGVLLVVQPSVRAAALHAPQLAALFAALVSAFAHMTVRKLNESDHPLVIVIVFTAITGVVGGALTVPDHVWPNSGQWLLLVGVAVCSTFAQWAMTTAYGRDTAATIAAAGYAQVAYALLIGWGVWGEWPDALSLAGASLITITGVALALARRTAPNG
jgi:drug/metabolite transporter (DMT)-like permease